MAATFLLSMAAQAGEVSIHTDFDGGSLGQVERVSETHFRCKVKGEVDQDGRNRQASWYYFRVDGAKGQSLTLDMIDLPGEYNYRPVAGAITARTLPFYSEDQKTWKQVEATEFLTDVPLLRLRLTPHAQRIWIAHTPPYTIRDLTRLLSEFNNHSALRQQTIGRSVGGRDLVLLTITDERVSQSKKKVIWLMFRQHAWESGSSWTGEGALRFLLSSDPIAKQIRRETIFKIFPMSDPDGVARGGVRFNAHGYDLNRNWDAVDDEKMPEIAAQRKAVLEWVDAGNHVDIFLSLHNTETSEYVEGPPDAGERYRSLMTRFSQLLSDSKRFAPTKSAQFTAVSTTVDKPGRMNVYQGLYRDRKLPAFLIEQMIVKHPELGRQPTTEDRRQFGVDLVRAMWRAVKIG
ncbi:MAG: hypothetical protein H0T92_09105 [Pyrinomonadaceae bacterium]|nr:hypothetical protein [Pyrinomonadaceae bacterium]